MINQKFLLVKLIAQYPTGRILFRIGILLKNIFLLMSKWSQRAVEYPWLIRNLSIIDKGSLVLDVGCAESLLSHELIAKKLKVVGIDIRNYPFKDKRMVFLRRNIQDTKLQDNLFDAIIIVSTIEHIGLEAYGQSIKDTDGDIKALEELKRILKPQGIIIITTPYVRDNPLKIDRFERYYRQRLKELINGMKVVKEDYFYPYKAKKRLLWIKLQREEVDKLSFHKGPGLACIILKNA